jgi:hypothetical protein
MSESLLEKYTTRALADRAETIESDAADDLGCFGLLRGVRDRAVMLELRKRSGHVLAIGYGYLERAEFDPSEGIILHALGRSIKLKGRNLNGGANSAVTLFGGICRHRVPWVQEASRGAVLRVADSTPVVDAIEW